MTHPKLKDVATEKEMYGHKHPRCANCCRWFDVIDSIPVVPECERNLRTNQEGLCKVIIPIEDEDDGGN